MPEPIVTLPIPLPAPTLNTMAFPPPPAKLAALEKLAALRKAEVRQPSPFDPPKINVSALPPLPGAAVPAPVPVADPPPKIDMDAGTLKRLTALAKENRENKTKLAALEASGKDAATFAEVKQLYAAGKRLEAIAKFTGKDGTDEMEALMADYLNAPTAPAKDDASAALSAKVDELIARDVSREKTIAEQAARIQAQQIATFAQRVLDGVTDGSLELCARAENRDEAAAAALEVVKTLALERKLVDVTPDQATALYREAFTLVENEYVELGKRYTRGSPQTVPGQRGQPAATRAPIAETPQTGLTPTLPKAPIATTNQRPLTMAEHRARAIEAMRAR